MSGQRDPKSDHDTKWNAGYGAGMGAAVGGTIGAVTGQWWVFAVTPGLGALLGALAARRNAD